MFVLMASKVMNFIYDVFENEDIVFYLVNKL